MTISELYEIYLKNPKISTDSRKINSGDLFWALSGENFNGNDYAENAIKSGATFAIVDDEKLKSKDHYIFVKDALNTLQELAILHRDKLNIPILAITGTNGKTTTKELISAVLQKKYIVSSTKGNFNNHIGVPLTLLSMDSNTEIGIVEMGANHPGEIKFLCNIAKPNYGIITNIGKAHLEGFGSFESLKKTKAELYDWISSEGTLFLNNDNDILKSLIQKQKLITYGSENDVFCEAKLLSADPYLNLIVNLSESIHIQTKLIGSYNFENVLAAACIGKYFEIDDSDIKNALENYIPQNNRSQIIHKYSSNIILDAYNANPTSLGLAIDNFKKIKTVNKLLILGDMFELGDYSENEHLEICKKLTDFKKEDQNTLIYLAGKEFHKIVRKNNFQHLLISFETTDELIANIRSIAFHNFWVLIKGSRGMKLETVVDNLNLT